MADSLLAAADQTHVPHGPPIALVIVPTRELAAQVREELRWLFAGARLRLASFTGGTPVVGDLAGPRSAASSSSSGPPGGWSICTTPGLQLGDLQVLVLDEADEMLDLGSGGSRDLLGHAPAERRTLLFSATLPRRLSARAAAYQRDPLASTPAAAGARARRPHETSRYVRPPGASGDRLAAVVNVLLRGGGRQGDHLLHARARGWASCTQRLVDHGFKAAAISAIARRAIAIGRSRQLRWRRRARAGGDQRGGARPRSARRRAGGPRRFARERRVADPPQRPHRARREKGTASSSRPSAERRKAERLLDAAP